VVHQVEMKTSVIIPSRDEELLARTVEEVFAKARGDVEVIVVLDGPTSYPLPECPNLVVIDKPRAEGLRAAINDAARVARGKYLLKIDAHSAISEGFDEVLQRDCDDDWVVSPRYFKLNTETWGAKTNWLIDYFYLSFPWINEARTGYFMFVDSPWGSRRAERKHVLIDDQMAFQGSCWFMTADHFRRLHGLDEDLWGPWSMEQQEIALKTWLGGGRVVVNKNVWNAHYHKPFTERARVWTEYEKSEDYRTHERFTRYFVCNQWEERVHDFDWLVERFWPLPQLETARTRWELRNYWPENWREYYDAALRAGA